MVAMFLKGYNLSLLLEWTIKNVWDEATELMFKSQLF